MVEFVVAIDEARVRFTDDAHLFLHCRIVIFEHFVLHKESHILLSVWSACDGSIEQETGFNTKE